MTTTYQHRAYDVKAIQFTGGAENAKAVVDWINSLDPDAKAYWNGPQPTYPEPEAPSEFADPETIDRMRRDRERAREEYVSWSGGERVAYGSRVRPDENLYLVLELGFLKVYQAEDFHQKFHTSEGI